MASVEELRKQHSAFQLRIEQLRLGEDPEALARLLLEVTKFYKHEGAVVADGAWYQAYMSCALEALSLLKETSDKRLLAAAHRAMNLRFFIDPAKAKTHLETALALSTEVSDFEGMGHALLQLSQEQNALADGSTTYLQDQAEVAFRAGECWSGLGLILTSKAMRASSPWESKDLLFEAYDLFTRASNRHMVGKTFIFLLVFGKEALTDEEIESLVLRAREHFEAENDPKNLADVYRLTTHLYRHREEPEQMRKYTALEDSLDIAIYGSRLARLQKDLETHTENLPISEPKHRKWAREEIKRLKKEIIVERRKVVV